jgi:predicted CxxxxCH...CXXCH cytochrome family protein
VGAHQRHLVGGSIRGPLACYDCHTVPTDLAHATQPLDLSWGLLASADRAVPTWNATDLTCTNYCHGSTMAGGSVFAPVWNRVDGTQADCGSCHGLPPPPPHVPVGSLTGCIGCHPGTVNANGTINVAGGLHVNGRIDADLPNVGSCTMCHGDASRSPVEISAAPPVDARGNTSTTAPGVGAHQRHLVGGSVRGPVACSECHVVPTTLVHGFQPLQLTWGPLARADGASPTFNATALTCANYCHGATMAGGALTAPVWNLVNGTQAACGTCHGLPPSAPHPAVAGGAPSCSRCHGGTVKPDGTIDVAGGLHVNGTVELSGGTGACTGCHGDETRQPASIAAAPPIDLAGNSATSSPGVGAHQKHLVGGSVRGPVACTECHVVPTDLAHVSQPLQLTWGPLARADGASPTFNATALTCANYCHGSTMAGGTITAPVWNLVNGTQAACGTCHGLPPASPHPAVSGGVSACAGCHAGTVNPNGTINVAGGLHVNGTVELSGTGGACTGCHGDQSRQPVSIAGAPPFDTAGNVATSFPGVGAHQRHLVGGSVRGPLACSDCHTVPATVAHATQPLDLTWGALARADGASPTYDRTAHTCANYCHGSTMGVLVLPVWNLVNGSQAACGTCHGLPPAAPHPAVSGGTPACAGCHAGTVNANGTINLAGGLHVNGLVEVAGTSGCTGCHGDPARTPAAIAPAPPLHPRGATATTAAGVGAHQKHLVAGAVRGPIACDECHTVPGDLAHATQPLQLTWGALARADGAAPTFDANALTCANYCHGSTMAGGSLTAPVWNRVNGTQAACGTCHGLPPSAPHPAVSGGAPACSGCHLGTVNPDGTINVAGGLHVNGTVELSGGTGSCTGCHGDATRTPAAIAPAPPLDTRGNAVTTAAGVGAHQRHLVGGSIRGPVACTECHTVPGDLAHASQPLQLTWGPLATALNTSASFNASSLTCANYCHGARLAGGSVTTPLWNKVDGSQAACGTCHGVPPPSPHPAVAGGVTACAGCHAGTVNPDGTINVTGGLHIDGVVQATGGHLDYTSPATHGPKFFDYLGAVPGSLACDSCHGADYGGGMAPSCNACHASAGWTGWQTNCSFCHGTKNGLTQAGYDVAAFPTWSAPPDAISQRLTGTAAPARTGAHQAHLVGMTSDGMPYAMAFTCGTCHTVPSSLASPHIDGAGARASVSLSGAGQGSLAANLGAYDPALGSCTTYCHGNFPGGFATPSPNWSGMIQGCASCHPDSPTSGQHSVSSHQVYGCGICHSGYSPSTINPALHVNGRKDVGGAGTEILYWGGGTCSPTGSCHGPESW